MTIKWTNKITNKELRRLTQQKPRENRIKRRKCNLIGHTLCKEVGATEETGLDWNPQGYRRGRMKRTWMTTEDEEEQEDHGMMSRG